MTSRTLAETEETTTYVWTCMNRLRQRQVAGVPQETNAYDAGGIRRLKKDAATGDSTKYFSSGAVSIADKTPTGNISFIQGGQLLGMLQNGNFYFYISDGLSSVRVLVDSDGNEAASASYNEFGMPENVSDSGGLMKHGYTGALGVRNETAGSGLMYMRQRWYDPSIGSWLSEDPIGFAGGFNTTNYVSQNPTKFSDPSGRDELDNREGAPDDPNEILYQKIRAEATRLGYLRDTTPQAPMFDLSPTEAIAVHYLSFALAIVTGGVSELMGGVSEVTVSTDAITLNAVWNETPTPQQILGNPSLLKNRVPADVRGLFYKTDCAFGKMTGSGPKAGKGFNIRMLKNGNPTGAYIQYSPGPSQHAGLNSYWKVSVPNSGPTQYIPNDF